jgi:single-strand DNA-binding protein
LPWEQKPLASGYPRKTLGRKRINNLYIYSVTIVGFVGADPEQRKAKSNGSKFTVFSLATQRAWKNVDDELSSKVEWHRIVLSRPRLAEHIASTIKKGAHVLVEGSLVSSTYEQLKGKSKKAETTKITSWSMRAIVVRKLDRGEPEPEVNTSGSASSSEIPSASEDAPFCLLLGKRSRGSGPFPVWWASHYAAPTESEPARYLEVYSE